MAPSDAPLPRRALLGGALAGLTAITLGGCDLADPLGGPGPRWGPGTHPMAGTLATAVYLLGRYDATIAQHQSLATRLEPLRAAHTAHRETLVRELGLSGGGVPPSGRPPVSPSPSAPPATAPPTTAPTATAPPTAAPPSPAGTAAVPVPADPATALTALRDLERTAYQEAAGACATAPFWAAAVLGSVAACRASHAEVLR